MSFPGDMFDSRGLVKPSQPDPKPQYRVQPVREVEMICEHSLFLRIETAVSIPIVTPESLYWCATALGTFSISSFETCF